MSEGSSTSYSDAGVQTSNGEPFTDVCVCSNACDNDAVCSAEDYLEGAEPRGTFSALPHMPSDPAMANAGPVAILPASPPDNPSLLPNTSRARRSKLPPLKALPGGSQKLLAVGLLSPTSEAMRTKNSREGDGHPKADGVDQEQLDQEPLPDDYVRQGAEPGEPAHRKSNGCGDAPNNGCADATKKCAPDVHGGTEVSHIPSHQPGSSGARHEKCNSLRSILARRRRRKNAGDLEGKENGDGDGSTLQGSASPGCGRGGAVAPWPSPDTYEATSLLCLSLDNPLRRLCIRCIEAKWSATDTWADSIVTVLILLNTIQLMMFDPLDTKANISKPETSSGKSWPPLGACVCVCVRVCVVCVLLMCC